MTEKNMQKNVLTFLNRKLKKWKIHSEYPFIHGTADIMIQKKNKTIIFELKLKASEQLLKQCIKHKVVADGIIAIAYEPKQRATRKKWEETFRQNQIKLIWIEKLSKRAILKYFRNKNINYFVRKSVYEI